MKSARRRAADPFRVAKVMMTEAALAMLAEDPRRVEKAERALASLRACSLLSTSAEQSGSAAREGDNE